MNSYIPRTRAEVDPLLQQVPAAPALEKLRALGVRFIVFHKDLILTPEENVLPRMKASPELRLSAEDPRLAIFEILS